MFISKSQVSPSADINKQVPTKVASAEVIKQAPKKAVKKKPQPKKKKRPVAVKPKQVEQPKPVKVEEVAPVYGENEAMQFIFAHESTNNPLAIAPNGACGLGQSLPCSNLLNACGSLDNVDCQIEFFTKYAVSRYGSWSGAMQFWQANNWW